MRQWVTRIYSGGVLAAIHKWLHTDFVSFSQIS